MGIPVSMREDAKSLDYEKWSKKYGDKLFLIYHVDEGLEYDTSYEDGDPEYEKWCERTYYTLRTGHEPQEIDSVNLLDIDD